MAASPLLVPAPAGALAAPFGLLSVAYIDDRADARLAIAGGVQYPGIGCVPAHTNDAACPQPPLVDPDDEEAEVPWEGRSWVTSGDPFMVWTPHRCRIVGDDPNGVEDRAREAMSLREGTAIERVFIDRAARSPLAVDLTDGGGAMHVVDGIAALERYARSTYGAAPVLHMDPMVATLATTHGTVIRSGARLETVLGSLVAAGGGYDEAGGPGATPDPPGAGEAWVYVTGRASVWRSPVEVHQAFTPSHNEEAAVASRAVAVAAECIIGAVLVRTSYVEGVAA